MKNEINLLKNNDERTDTDLEWIEEFYEFLQDECSENIRLRKGHQPKMSAKKAFAIIWYLQEHFPVFPDTIEKCWNCDNLFDTDSEGIYWQSKYRHYCSNCKYLVPYTYDRGLR